MTVYRIGTELGYIPSTEARCPLTVREYRLVPRLSGTKGSFNRAGSW